MEPGRVCPTTNPCSVSRVGVLDHTGRYPLRLAIFRANDRDLGPTPDCRLVKVLRKGGMQVEPHNAHFPNTVPDDHVWLGLCGNKGGSVTKIV